MPMLDPADPETRGEAVATAFGHEYGGPPAVVAVAPGRVNLIGEHTDYNRGLVLPVALPHLTWTAARSRDDDRVRVTSLQQDDSWSGTLADLGPGMPAGWATYVGGVVWALREAGLEVGGLDLLVDSTVPVGAGLSSSAALECSVAVAVATLAVAGLDDGLDEPARGRLVAACVRAETEVAQAPTGGMDQTVAVFAQPGHALLIDFALDPTDAAARRAVPLGLDTAGLALLVTDTRVSHALADGGYGDRRAECGRAAAALGVGSLRDADPAAAEGLDDDLLRRRARHVVTEDARVEVAVEALEHGDWEGLGRAMRESHDSLRDDFEVSCAELDLAVDTAVGAGALGARMTGGGFGGSSVALVPRDRIDEVAEAIDRAFAAAGHGAPAHLDAVPSDGARVLSRSAT